MKLKIIFCLMLLGAGNLFANGSFTNDIPHELTGVWQYINYPFPKPQEWNDGPLFSVSSGAQYDQVAHGLRLDVMYIQQGFQFIKTNGVSVVLYRANGEIAEPTKEGKKMLTVPYAASSASYPGEEMVPSVMTYFPWGSNVLEESWMKVTVGAERYWLEVPYGFDCDPTGPPPPPNTNGPPKFVSAMDSLNKHDHVVRWENIFYDLGQTQNGALMLLQSNPFYGGISEVHFYDFPRTVNVFSPHTGLSLTDSFDAVTVGRCTNIHLGDESGGRTDTYEVRVGNRDNLRCAGRLEITVDTNSFHVVIPSSLYEYVHSHAHEPSETYFISFLQLGMPMEQVNSLSRNYISDGIRNHSVPSSNGHQYRYTSKSNSREVTVQFDDSQRLVGWSESRQVR